MDKGEKMKKRKGISLIVLVITISLTNTTNSENDVSEEPVSNKVKTGDGAVRVDFMGVHY